MALDWTNVRQLDTPLQTTGDDVIFSGHGALVLLGKKTETAVPKGIELWLLAPPAASIADASGQALESMQKITRIGIQNAPGEALSTMLPIRYKAGEMAPNYVLQAPDGITLKPKGPHVLGVTADTELANLWDRVTPFIKPDKTVRCFWAACTAIDGAGNPTIFVD